MEEVAHDRPVRHLRVVGVRVVDGMVFSLTDIRLEGLAMILLLRIVGPPVVLDEFPNPRIGAGRVIRWIRKREDVFVLPDGETLDLAELRILQLLGEQPEVMLPAGRVGGEGLPEAFDGTVSLRRSEVQGGLGGHIRRDGNRLSRWRSGLPVRYRPRRCFSTR